MFRRPLNLVEVPKNPHHDQQRYGQNEEEGKAHEQRQHLLFPIVDDPGNPPGCHRAYICFPKVLIHAHSKWRWICASNIFGSALASFNVKFSMHKLL